MLHMWVNYFNLTSRDGMLERDQLMIQMSPGTNVSLSNTHKSYVPAEDDQGKNSSPLPVLTKHVSLEKPHKLMLR